MQGVKVKDNILTISMILTLLTGFGASLYFLIALKINNYLGWLLFGGWVLVPYVMAGVRSYILNDAPLKKTAHFIALTVAIISGLYLLLDAIYINPDPQGGLAVLMVPIFQVPIYLAIYFIAVLVGNKCQASHSS